MRWRLWAGAAVTLLLTCEAAQPAAGAAPASVAWPILDEMGQQLEDPSRPTGERLEVITAFAGWTGPQVRPPLVAVLKDPSPEIREAAARALGWPGNDEAVPPLRERFEAPGEAAAVKAAAVTAFGIIGDRSVRALVITATADPDASIRGAALSSLALGALVDPADRTVYLIRLAEDRAIDAQSRADAVQALASVKEKPVVEALVRILESEPRSRIFVPPGTLDQQQIMVLRYRQARDVAGWAAGALGPLEGRTATPLLLKTAEDPDDYFLRLMSLRSLVSWNVPEAYSVLVNRLVDPIPDVRLLALTGLARLGDPKAVDPVLGRLADGSPDVRALAVATAGYLGGPRVRPQLEALQEKESEPSVLGALEAELSRLAR